MDINLLQLANQLDEQAYKLVADVPPHAGPWEAYALLRSAAAALRGAEYQLTERNK